VIDIGEINAKILATGQKEPRKFPSGPTMIPRRMVAGVKELTKDWKHDVVPGGGNVPQLEKLPEHCRSRDNANAFTGGFLLWKKKGKRP
jgi:hypothetical protein